VAEGEASDEVLYVARNLKCDVIVLGTHGRTGLERLLSGTVAEAVLRKAPCPVMAARTPPPKRERPSNNHFGGRATQLTFGPSGQN
jgi:hypothetical protein